MKLKLKKLHPKAKLPVYSTAGAACFDLHALDSDQFDSTERMYGKNISERGPSIFDTGLAFEIPEGWVMLIFSRSGHGFKNNVRLANATGVIDSDYKGEVKVKLTADSQGQLSVKPNDRIAQAMLVRAEQWALEWTDELSESWRGTGGFGSTGN